LRKSENAGEKKIHLYCRCRDKEAMPLQQRGAAEGSGRADSLRWPMISCHIIVHIKPMIS
jgi:hypothetical protein